MKLNLKIISILAILVVYLSCEVPYRDNARLLIKGQVLDENSQPISGVNISVYAREGISFLSGTLTTLLNETESLADGSFSTIMLLALDENFVVEVSVNDNYSRYQYRTDTTDFVPEDYLIDLGTVPIQRLSSVNYNITKENASSSEFFYTLTYPTTQCTEVYSEGELSIDETSCYETTTRSRSLNTNNPNDTGNFATTLGAEVLFTYTINGQPQVVQTLIIDQTDYEFNFSY